MPISPASVIYTVAGGLVLYSGIKGDTLADMAKAVLTGNLGGINATQTIDFSTPPTATGSGSPSSGGTATEPTSATAAANQAAAKKTATSMGLSSWTTGQQWADWVKLWNQESGWRTDAQNPTSTAYGIAQFLDSTWAPYGPKTSDPGKQIKYGIEYIKSRYGSPSMAWAHEVANNWY